MSFAGVPLLARGTLLGVLCVNYRERHQFSDYDRRLIALFAQQAAAVIASSKLVRDHERRRIENDLHDLVKSSVRGLILLSKAASQALLSNPSAADNHLHEIRRAGWGILADVELILNDLAPSELHQQSIQRFITNEVQRLVGANTVALALTVDTQLGELPMDLARTLLHVLREAVMNALEHAHAQTLQVTVSCGEAWVCVYVVDDGCGFVPETVGKEHRGLTIMRERVAMVAGEVQVTSSSGCGTTIMVRLPRKEADHDAD